MLAFFLYPLAGAMLAQSNLAFSFFGRKSPDPGKAPAAERKAPPRPLEPPPSTVEDDGLGMDAGEDLRFEVLDCGIDPRLEQAAVLFAAGHPEAARALLEATLAQGDAPQEAWYMLFELCEMQGESGRQRFDELALAYAARFELSPPAWVDTATHEESSSQSGRAVLPLTGRLDAHSAQALEQLRRMAAGNATLRVDLAKLRGADAAGCALLLAALEHLRRTSRACVLSGAGALTAQLAQLVGAGASNASDASEPVWLLLLELYQRQSEQTLFEDLALQYALRFEVSPPSWSETPALAEAEPGAPSQATAASLATQVPCLCGDVVGAGAAHFSALDGVEAVDGEVRIDVSQLRRIDFVSAGNLLNTVIALQKAGRRLHFCQLSHLVAALLTSVGIGRLAQLETIRN